MANSNLQPVVECIGLSKVFKDFWGRAKVQAAENVDLAVQPGEVFGLLGPNGSGKSTIIKMLLGLLYPTSGRARVFDRPPTDTRIKARIGFMPEESYLYRFLNAAETLDYYGRLFKLDRAERHSRTQQLIDMVGLTKAARRQVGQYSKGMARRIGLAQALINDPDLLILDEPTTGLDPIGARQIKDVIKALAERGKTVILCTHMLDDVEDVCDRIAIMYGGKVRATGTVKELLSRHEITQIRTDRLADKTLNQVRALVEADGVKVHAVDHPTDRLEDFFLRVVETAQRERLETSGAVSGRGVTDFLSAPPGGPERGRRIVDQLAAAGAASETPAVSTPRSEMRAEAAKSAAVLDALVATNPDDVAAAQQAAGQPAPKKQADRTDRNVLDRLTKNN